MNIGNITLRLILLISTLMLCGCGKTDTCLEPDDFGFAKMTVSARYADSEIFGDQTAEITPWRDGGLILNGKPLYISVKNWIPREDPNESGVLSAWCPWYGDKDHGSTLTKYCERLNECNFVGSDKCPRDADGMPTDDNCLTKVMCTNTTDAQIANPPCLMTKGVGLYALLAKPTYNNNTSAYIPYNPNISINTMSNPDSAFTYAMHMGQPHSQYYISSMSNSGKMTNSGGVVYDYDKDHTLNSSRINYVNGKLYFKILDHFYQDNNGQYRIFIKSGVFNGGWDPISWCISLVKTSLFGNGGNADYSKGGNGIVPAIYSAVVVNTGFTNTVRATLMLFVIFSAFGFLMGSIELTQKELVERILKVIIIVTLISPGSWKFFNEHIFIWFYEGTDFIINILYQVAASGPGSSNPLDFFFSEEIFIKLSSLLFATATGWIYICVYIVMLVFLVKIYFDAAVLYMTALIMVGVLISIAPIFIVFLLFEQTKSFFDNWIKQITSYSVQMILVYAGILFMTLIIRNQIYNTLGFPTCAVEFPSVGPLTIFKWYFPKISSTNPKLAMIPIPKDHFETIGDINAQTNAESALSGGFAVQDLSASTFCKNNPNNAGCKPGTQTGKFCGSYECNGLRYPDLPFLDPNDPYESKLIAQIRSGYIGDFGGLAIIVVCIYLMDHFNKTTVSMAKFLSSTTANSGSNAAAASSASAGLRAMTMAPVNFVAQKSGFSAAVQDKRDSVHNFFAMAKYKMVDKPWANHKIGSLKEDAIKGGLKSVRKEAEKLSNMSHAEATEFNKNLKNSSYAEDLQKNLEKNRTREAYHYGNSSTDPNRNYVEPYLASKAIMDKLSNGKAEDFKNIATKELFGRNSRYEHLKGDIDFSKLSAEDAKTINKISNEMKPILEAKAKQEAYADNYAKAYIKMSDEGVGLLRKSSSIARGSYNLNEKLKSNIQSWDDASLDRARSISEGSKSLTDKLLPDAFKQVDYKKLYSDQAALAQKSAAELHTDRAGPGGQGASTTDPFGNKRNALDNQKASEKALISNMLYHGRSEKDILNALEYHRKHSAENLKAAEAELANAENIKNPEAKIANEEHRKATTEAELAHEENVKSPEAELSNVGQPDSLPESEDKPVAQVKPAGQLSVMGIEVKGMGSIEVGNGMNIVDATISPDSNIPVDDPKKKYESDPKTKAKKPKDVVEAPTTTKDPKRTGTSSSEV